MSNSFDFQGKSSSTLIIDPTAPAINPKLQNNLIVKPGFDLSTFDKEDTTEVKQPEDQQKLVNELIEMIQYAILKFGYSKSQAYIIFIRNNNKTKLYEIRLQFNKEDNKLSIKATDSTIVLVKNGDNHPIIMTKEEINSENPIGQLPSDLMIFDCNFKPLRDKLLVQVLPQRHEGVIHLLDTDESKKIVNPADFAMVINTGDGKFLDNGIDLPNSVRTGDRIMISKYVGSLIKIDNQHYKVIGDLDCMGVLEED